MTDRPRRSAYDRAVALLARRAHFSREIERKLRDRGYDDGEIAAAVRRLEGEGYLDDAKLAREFAAAKARRSGVGAARVRAELGKRGIDADAAREAVADALPDDDLEAVTETAGRWARTHAPDRAALGRHLQRKGFSMRAIVRVLQDFGADAPDPHEPADEE